MLGVVAGPASVAGLRANDRIVRINGEEVDATRANAIINSSVPGERLMLEVIRGDQSMTMTMVIDITENWFPPSAFASAIPFSATGLSVPDDHDDRVMSHVLSAAPQAEPVLAGIDRMLAERAREDVGYHKLPLIRTAMLDPTSMSRWREELTETLRPFEFRYQALLDTMCDTLAIKCTKTPSDSLSGPVSLQQFAQQIDEANQAVRAVFEAAQINRTQASADLHYLLRTTAADRTLIGQDEVYRGIRSMQSSMRMDLTALLAAAELILRNAMQPPERSGQDKSATFELGGIVEGEILDYTELDAGYVVVGGPGANHYDMSRIYAVVDAGGNDSYSWNDTVPLETQTIVDLEGDDRYRAVTAGPGAGWLGVSVLIDLAGSDHYQSTLGGCGSGAFGFGFLFDDSGKDTYQCTAWSAGAAIYGAGVLVDQGEHTDVYSSQVFSQGVGGPRGMGILIDAGGSDLYRASGTAKSAYDTPGSFMAFSQGVGTGIRPYDAGGVGVLLDFGGDDRYEGGEFTQGGGYLWGVGLLFDEAGNDLYYGDRYAQGFASHQAFGMLTDMSGDDVYWGKSAATQGAAWDQSVAVLFDAEGNDFYRAHSLSQGAAAQQSRALLHDVSGDDRYWSSARTTQGAAGSNQYHFKSQDPVFSLGVLFDERGNDRYSTGIDNGETLLRSRANSPNGNGVAGVAVDLE